MALTESTEYGKIDVKGIYKLVQVRKDTVIKKDDVELSRSYTTYDLNPGALDDSDNLVDTDLSAEPAEIQAICNAAWSDQVKADFKAYLLTIKPE